MSTFSDRFAESMKRKDKAAAEGLDIAGRKIKVGDVVAYGVSLGRSAGVQIATVVGFSPKGKPQLKIDERFRKTYGEKEVVTVQYFDRMAILSPIENEEDAPVTVHHAAETLLGHLKFHPPESFFIAVGTEELHVYVRGSAASWSGSLYGMIDGFPVNWHFDVGPIVALTK